MSEVGESKEGLGWRRRRTSLSLYVIVCCVVPFFLVNFL